MASKKTRAKRRQERMQQLQRNAAIPPAQVSMEDLTPKAEGIAAEETAEPDVHRTFPTDMRESILAKEVEQRCQSIRGKKMKVAVMGCVVNGPGEAREADLGIAGGDGVGLIFRRGEIIKKVPQEQLVDALMDEIAQYEGE